MTREEQMWKAVEDEHGTLSQRELYVTLTAMEWADENKPVDWQQVRIQAAITAMQGYCSSLETLKQIDMASRSIDQFFEIISIMCKNTADALVKELKGE